jgi:cell division septation protein DedD
VHCRQRKATPRSSMRFWRLAQLIRAEAQQVLDAKYMTVIASLPDQGSAQAAAEKANIRFRSAQSDLRAIALAPGNTPFWGVYVGSWVTLTDARALVQKARQQGYRDAYVTRAPS